MILLPWQRLITALEEIISGMPQKCQTAFRLKWFEGKKYAK